MRIGSFIREEAASTGHLRLLRFWTWGFSLLTGVSLVTLMIGCNQDRTGEAATKPEIVAKGNSGHLEVRTVEYYEEKLLDKSFRWKGPASREIRIPSLHAARALAYIGDPAVPALLRAIEKKSVDIYSVNDALAEIGLPVHLFSADIQKRDPRGLAKWWSKNSKKTVSERSKHREFIGLPPIAAGKR
jgi:hypothetical protein